MATAQEVTTKRKPFGKKLVNYLAANPSEYDVTFLVGPEKKEIRSLRIALKAASPALDKLFKEKWETGLGRGESGIPLPDLDPVTFQTFIELLLSDDWSVQAIEGMNFPAEIILNVLKMTKDFGMKDFEKVMQLLADKIFMDFETFSNSVDFFQLSRENLEIILASDLLTMNEIKIFNVACKWAEKQCAKHGLKPTGHNLRGRLGSAIFKIRFPLMTNTEFGTIVSSKEILTMEEQLQLFVYISTGNKQNSQQNPFLFNTQRRRNGFDLTERVPVPVAQAKISATIVAEKKQGGNVYFFKDINIVNDPSFVCGGKARNFIGFKASSTILLESIGFLGPVNGDATYDVTIDVQKPNGSLITLRPGYFIQKKVAAIPGQIFHVSFITPPIIEDYATQQKRMPPEIKAYVLQQERDFSSGNGYYWINVLFQGPDTQSAQYLNGSSFKDSRSEVDGVTIYARHLCDQVAELKFRKY